MAQIGKRVVLQRFLRRRIADRSPDLRLVHIVDNRREFAASCGYRRPRLWAQDNPVRVIDVFVDELDLNELGFEGMEPEATGRPGYHPASLLRIYIYGYLQWPQAEAETTRVKAD